MLKISWRLPKRLILPGSHYWWCLDFLLEEMYDPKTLEWLTPPEDEIVPACAPDSAEEALALLKGVLAAPYWERRAFLQARSNPELDRRLVEMVERQKRLVRRGHDDFCSVDPRDVVRWMRFDPQHVARWPKRSREIQIAVRKTTNYAQWIAQRGSPDFARWIADAYEEGAWG